MLSLAQLEHHYLSHHRGRGSSPKTIAHYEDSFRLMDEYLESVNVAPTTEALTSQTFQGLFAYLKRTPTRGFRGSTERTIHGIQGVMRDWRAVCRWALEENHIEVTPKVPIPKLPQTLFPVLSEADLAKIFTSRHLDSRTEIGIRNRALVSFMLDTGVRKAEAAALTPADIDLKEGMAKVRGKGNKERMVFFSKGVEDSLRRWLAIRGNEPGSLFWLTPSGLRMVLERIRVEVGLPVLHPHQIRHTAATMMVKHHADLHTVKRILGHAQLSTVEVYLSLSNEDLKEKHTAVSPFERIREQVEPNTRGRRRLRAS